MATPESFIGAKISAAIAVDRWEEAQSLILEASEEDLCQKSGDKFKANPLAWSSFKGHIGTVVSIVRRGEICGLDLNDLEGNTALDLAVRQGHVEVVRVLLDGGASVVYADSEFGWGPLHRACARGNLPMTQLLLDRGAFVDQRKDDGFTPLHLAVQGLHASVAKHLLDHGAQVNIKYAREVGWTPLHFAVMSRSEELVQLLLRHGADVNVQKTDLRTPLHVAVGAGYASVAKILIEAGASLDVRDKWKSTPLHCAAKKGCLAAAKTLVKAGAQLNLTDMYDSTPLLLVVENLPLLYTAIMHEHSPSDRRLQLIKLLVTGGANLAIRNAKNATAVSIAVLKGHFAVVDFLLKRGAPVYPRSLSYSELLCRVDRLLPLVSLILKYRATIDMNTNKETLPLQMPLHDSQFSRQEQQRMVIMALGKAGAKFWWPEGEDCHLRRENPYFDILMRLHMFVDEGKMSRLMEPCPGEAFARGTVLLNRAAYYRRVSSGDNTLPFMKSSFGVRKGCPLLQLPPEMLEHVYMYCLRGRLEKWEMRMLYSSAILLGMGWITDREIVHGALELMLKVHIPISAQND